MSELGLLKNKEEVLEFLNNLGIEYRYGCYENKNPEACQLLAEFVEIVEQNIEKSTKLYRYACNMYNMGQSCHNYANALFYGRGIKTDYQKSLDFYEKGCLVGYGTSCFNAGQINFNEHKKVREVIPKNIDKAITLFEKGCALFNAESCSYGAYLHQSTLDGTKEPNREMAFKLADRGCTLNEINSCVYLTKAYSEGLGCEKNETKVKELTEKVKVLLEQLKRGSTKNEMQRFT